MLVTEARERVGGNITSRSDPAAGYLWEEGPNSFQPNDSMLNAAVDAGVADQLVFGDPKAPRFVWWEGKLRPTPSGPDVVTFDLMSIPGKIRAGLGAAGIWKAPMPAEEESVEKFVRRNLGAEVFERLIEPFCSGVYAGDPSKLSMKAAFGKVYDLELKGGSIVGGVLALLKEKKANPPPERDARLPPKPAGQTVGSFRAGLGDLPAAIAARLGADRVRLGWQLEGIAPGGPAGEADQPEGLVDEQSGDEGADLPLGGVRTKPAALSALGQQPCRQLLSGLHDAVEDRLHEFGHILSMGDRSSEQLRQPQRPHRGAAHRLPQPLARRAVDRPPDVGRGHLPDRGEGEVQSRRVMPIDGAPVDPTVLGDRVRSKSVVPPLAQHIEGIGGN